MGGYEAMKACERGVFCTAAYLGLIIKVGGQVSGEESRSSWTENREGIVSNYLLVAFISTTAMATEQNIQTETGSEA